MKRPAILVTIVVAAVAATLTGFFSLGASPGSPDSNDIRLPANEASCVDVGDVQVWCPSTTTTTTGASTSTTSAPTTSTTESTTTSTLSPTSTSSPTTSTSPTTTSTTTTVMPSTTAATTTTISPTTTSAPAAPGCGLSSPAFCDTFDADQQPTGKTQTGDLSSTVWGVSRVADFDISQGKINGVTPSHNACAGGGTTGSTPPGDTSSHTFGPETPPPADVRICNGQLVDSVNDGGAVVDQDMYPKQPFNFAGRTGTVVFDVSADSSGSHGAWPDFLITDEPVPGVLECISECNLGSQGTVTARNEIGFAIDGDQTGNCPTMTGVGKIFTSVNGTYDDPDFTTFDNCITKGSPAAMNHFKVMLSQTRIDVYGTNAGSTVFKHLVGANVSLAFTQGLVWINDVHYNARKAVEPCACGTQYDHSFAWDNLGFDGQKTYRDLGFDVPYANNPNHATNQNGDNAEVQEGFNVGTGPVVLTVTGVNWTQTPTAAKVVLNSHNNGGSDISVSVNGGTQTHHALASPFHTETFSIIVPLSDVHTGSNTLTFRSNNGSVQVANVSLILVAAAAVP